MAFKMRYNKNVNIKRVVTKLATVMIVLYAGGYVIDAIGDVLNGTTLPFNQGFAILGWTVSSNQITDTTGVGILTVIGIIGVASVVLEFVQVSF